MHLLTADHGQLKRDAKVVLLPVELARIRLCTQHKTRCQQTVDQEKRPVCMNVDTHTLRNLPKVVLGASLTTQ